MAACVIQGVVNREEKSRRSRDGLVRATLRSVRDSERRFQYLDTGS